MSYLSTQDLERSQCPIDDEIYIKNINIRTYSISRSFIDCRIQLLYADAKRLCEQNENGELINKKLLQSLFNKFINEVKLTLKKERIV